MRSITRRFQWSFTLAASLLLCFSALLLYAMLHHYSVRDDYDFVNNEMHIIKRILQEHGQNIQGLRQEIVLEPQAIKNQFFTRIYTENQHLLIETPGINRIARTQAFPKPIKALEKDTLPSRLVTAADGQMYRLVALWITVSPHQRYLLEIAFNVTHQQKLLNQLQVYLIVITLTGIILAAVASVFLVRRGLRPVRDLSVAIHARNPENFNQQLTLPTIPQELIPLVSAFNDLMARIEASVQQLKQFSADLAHELRTPVNNLMGETEVALTKIRSVEEYQSILQSNLEEYQRLATIIEQMLFLARAENAETPLKLETVNVAELIRYITQYYHTVLEEKQIRVEQTGHAVVQADRGLLQRVFSNLFTNAIKYSPAHSYIQWQINTIDGAWVDIRIQDHGPGIAVEHHARIFERFYRIDGARTQNISGYGLGLSIVKSIIDLHHGQIHVASDGEKGTQFTIRLSKDGQ